MKKLLRNFDFVYFVVACLLGGASALVFFKQRESLAKNHLAYTRAEGQARFDALRKAVETENNTICQNLKKKFNALPTDGTERYAHYIFKNSQLIHWTDYHFAPTQASAKGDFRYKVLQTPQGYGLLIKSVAEIEQDSLSILSYLPLTHHYKLENKYLQSTHNQAITAEEKLKFSFESIAESPHTIVLPDKTPIFALVFQPDFKGKNVTFLWLVGGLAVGAVLLGLGALRGFSMRLHRKKRYELSVVMWVLAGLGLRFLMIYAVFPFEWTDWDLFNRALYPASRFTPSLGDLALNMLVLGGVLMYFLRSYPYSQSYKALLGVGQGGRIFLMGLLVFLTFWVTLIYYNALGSIFLHPEQRLAIANTLEWTALNGFGFAMFVALSGFYFFVLHTFTRICMQFTPRPLPTQQDFNWLALAIILVASVAFGAVVWGLKIGNFWLMGFHLAYLLTIYLTRLPRALARFRYATSIYLFFGALLAATVSTHAIYSFGAKSSLADKRAFGNMLLPENDAVAEQQLGEALKQMKLDKDLAVFLKSQEKVDLVEANALREKILKQYLGNYFSNYDIKLYLYGVSDSLPRYTTGDAQMRVETLSKEFAKIYYDTNNPNIKFINEAGVNSSKRYLAFARLEAEAGKERVAQIIIDLEQRIIDGQPQNVYPELLLGKNYALSPLAKHYSYAIYDDNALVYSKGEFNYEKDFRTTWFASNTIVRQGFVYKGIEHLAVQGGFKKQVVVSAPTYAFWDIFSNFSFFFLLLILCILLGVLAYSLYRGRYGVHATFSTRIQIYLNIAFFLPLFVVSLVTLNIMRANYQRDLENNYFRKGETVALNLQPQMLKLRSGDITRDEFDKHFLDIARHTGTDISLFDGSGRLITSSQPAIYEKANLLSSYINPKALEMVGKRKNRYAILPESVGKLEFSTTYLPLRNYEGDTRQMLGIVGIPFFEAQYELNKKQMELLALMVNIFSSAFIVLVAISFFASKLLTKPLRLITLQVRKTAYTDYETSLQNQPLEWEIKDEIGLFVQEYNRMIQNLDESRQKLIEAQRESAWREMAQQVAHEIKNPLMPMKLGVQMMEKRLESFGEDVQKTFERYVYTLLEKIEVLDDIATSFSAYAKMPIPVMENFDMVELMAETETLYTDTEGDITFEMPTQPCYVKADRKLLGRVFVNLIKNAIEAIPPDRTKQIHTSLKQFEDGLIQITIQDNGSGISEDKREKLFSPNFTTKSSGSGIGLALSKRAVEHANGRIWFETEEDIGTTFFIELPLAG